MIMDGHTLGVLEIVISDDSWNKLSEEQREWIQEAASYASGKCRSSSASRESNAMNALKAKGVTIVEVSNKDIWRNAVQSVITANLNGQESAYNAIRALK